MSVNRYAKLLPVLLIVAGVVLKAYFSNITAAQLISQSEEYQYYIAVRDFETKGFQVDWDPKNHSAVVVHDSHSVILPANSKIIQIDDRRIEIDKSHVVLNGKMLIPPSSYNMIMATLKPGYTERSIEALWDETVALHLKDKLWLAQNIYVQAII